jgi:hypothetical protein
LFVGNMNVNTHTQAILSRKQFLFVGNMNVKSLITLKKGIKKKRKGRMYIYR